MTMFRKTIAAAACSFAFAGAAHAATFEFEFFRGAVIDSCDVIDDICLPRSVDRGPRIGTGVLSYSGSVEVGAFAFGELADLDFEFSVDEFNYTEDDPIFTRGFMPSLNIFEGDGEIYAQIGVTIRPELVAEPLIAIARPEHCRGLVSILETVYDTCLNFSPAGRTERDGVDPYGTFSLTPEILEDGDSLLVQSFFDPIEGTYIARAVVSEVPVPASLPLLALGLAGLGYARKRRS